LTASKKEIFKNPLLEKLLSVSIEIPKNLRGLNRLLCLSQNITVPKTEVEKGHKNSIGVTIKTELFNSQPKDYAPIQCKLVMLNSFRPQISSIKS